MSKSIEAFRTIAEVADDLAVPKHVLRFWEVKFPQIRPMKRGGGRRYYRPEDLELLRGIQALLHAEAYTIKGVQKILREHGVDHVKKFGREPLSIPGGKQAGKRKRGAGEAGTPATAAAERAAPAPHSGRAVPPVAATGKPSTARIATTSRSAAGGTRQTLQAVLAELEACRALLRSERQQRADEAVAETGRRVRASR